MLGVLLRALKWAHLFAVLHKALGSSQSCEGGGGDEAAIPHYPPFCLCPLWETNVLPLWLSFRPGEGWIADWARLLLRFTEIGSRPKCWGLEFREELLAWEVGMGLWDDTATLLTQDNKKAKQLRHSSPFPKSFCKTESSHLLNLLGFSGVGWFLVSQEFPGTISRT